MDNVEEVKEPINIIFKVEVPKNTEDSIFNSIVLGLSEYKNTRDFGNFGIIDKDKQKELNNILMKVQHQIDDLIVFDE